MSSSDSSDDLDLERGLPVTPADVAAQRRAHEASRTMTFTEYLAFLASFPPASYEELKQRPHPRGEPFTLPF